MMRAKVIKQVKNILVFWVFVLALVAVGLMVIPLSFVSYYIFSAIFSVFM